ncbi:unnamed protein product [Adineta ricciae]|uniref:Uncharacterized protein n=1 Tax=Adineta ricciae TaxID=249248 RepID=A0A815DTX3_ADIRI|nr:unnamed protein product [Adineta ricciae]CAF1302030.1 unnamed protein product [Adineta ricciae]
MTTDARLQVTTTIGTIERRIFVGKWSSTYNFTGYYAAYSSSICTYTIEEHRAFLTIITTVIPLVGGLSRTTDVVVPPLARLDRPHLCRRIHRLKTSINQRKKIIRLQP